MYNPKLSVFLRAADTGSFNKTAEELFISAPALIKQINALEKELSLRLFERSNHGLSLTKAGESVYRDAKYIIEYSNAAIERAKNAARTEEYIIRLGASPMTPPQFLLDLWSKIHALSPQIKFQIVPFDNTPENARVFLYNFNMSLFFRCLKNFQSVLWRFHLWLTGCFRALTEKTKLLMQKPIIAA